jgi:2-polyprenyl-3-methyl-5-hydroxy-6-metoxy-1,4-benzoquinol methylase
MKNKLDTHLEAYQGKSIYDFDNEILLNWYPKRIIKLIDDPKNKSLLELGVGHGFSTNVFSSIFDRHLVLDGSKAVIDNFNSNYPESKAEIVETYFENYASEEKFDVIVLGFILEHVDDPCEILSKYRDFLTPNGKMYLAVPNAEVLNRRLGNLAGMLDDMESLSSNDVLLGHQRYYTVKTLSDDIQNSGYKIAKIEGIYLKPLTTKQMTSLNLGREIITSLCEVGINYPELSCGILAEVTSS